MDANDLSLILALSRERTLAAAAEKMGVDLSTVFRRLNALEARLQVRLFDRSPRGYQPTPAGQRAAGAAERVETELLALDREISGRDQQLSGVVRVTASETFSYAVLPTLFAQFRAVHPRIRVVLSIDNRVIDLSRREADVALRVRRPADPDLFGRKLTNVAWAFFGAREGAVNLRRDGKAFNFGKHSVIGWDESARIIASEWIAANVPTERISYRSNSLVNQLLSARAGLGLALLPCYLGDGDRGLERVLVDPVAELATELWMVTHRDLRNTARVRAFFDVVGGGMSGERNVFEGRGE